MTQDRFLRDGTLWETGAAILVSAVIARTSELPFFVALAVLLFNWPIASFIIEKIAQRAPGADQRTVVTSWWPPIVTSGIVVGIASAVAVVQHLRFFEAFAYTTLIVTFVGAVNGIVIELEDTLPGGWNNPEGVETLKPLMSIGDWFLRGSLWAFGALSMFVVYAAPTLSGRLAFALLASCAVWYSIYTFRRETLRWCRWLSLASGVVALAAAIWGRG